MSSLSITEQKSQAFHLGIAALLGEGIYNLGELVRVFFSSTVFLYLLIVRNLLKLAHPVLESLKNQEENWLVELLYIMNAGDIAGFHKLKPKWSSQTDLLSNERMVLQKITLLALMEVRTQAIHFFDS